MRSFFQIILLLLSAFSVRAEELREIVWDNPCAQRRSAESADTPFSWEIKGIVLLEESEPLLSDAELQGIEGVYSKRLLLFSELEDLHTELQSYFFKPLSEQKLSEIKAIITAHFQSRGKPLSYVRFPEEQRVGDILQVQVVRATLSESYAARLSTLPEELSRHERIHPNWQFYGIVILGPNEELFSPLELAKVVGVQTGCFRLPTDKRELQALLEPYFFEPLNEETLQKIRATLYRYFQDHFEPFVVITAPHQVVESGVIQLQVIRATLGEVFYVGCKRPIPRAAITMQPGQELYPSDLQADLEWLNRSPYRRVDAIYQAGSAPGSTDIVLDVREMPPWTLNFGTDNTGVQSLGRNRTFAGASIGWDSGYFTCQYTADYDFKKFQAVTAQYIAYLPWRHFLNLYGGYSWIHAHLASPSNKSNGESASGSFRYEIPFIPVISIQHQLTLGGDYKRTNNTLEFSELYERYVGLVNLTDLVLGYRGSWEKWRSRIDFEINLYGSPGEWLPDMTNADYNALRPGAKNQWIYGRGIFRYLQKTTRGFSTELSVRLQLSGDNLIPSEQMGIGGADTVRGYDERQLNYDEGVICNFEMRSPSIPALSTTRWIKTKDAIQFLAFFDYGIGRNHTPIPGETKQDYLMGIGPGARYTLDPWIALRLDWGVKLHTKPSFTGGWSMFHFSASGRF
jgi:hemolysin activation/secretion protein